MTDGEEGGVGDASLRAGDTCGGVEESSEESRGDASSESPEGGNTPKLLFTSKITKILRWRNRFLCLSVFLRLIVTFFFLSNV